MMVHSGVDGHGVWEFGLSPLLVELIWSELTAGEIISLRERGFGYRHPPESTTRLTHSTGGGWQLIDHGQAKLRFNTAGLLQNISDPIGNTLRLIHLG